MEVSKSGYYAWKGRPKSQRKIDNERLLIDIKRVFLEHNQNYGSPRIYNALRKEHIQCSENRIAGIMRINGLMAAQRRRFRVTTNSRHNWPVASNLLKRNFITGKPNKIWVTTITYIWTWEGWLYLAFVLDLYYRGVVGLAMSENITDELTQDALKQAVMRRNPPEGLIHHSDRGSQYASGDYQALLKKYQIIPSMSRKGDCWDNAVGESFIHTLKGEKINRCRFKTRKEAKREIFEYAEVYYNRKRDHSSGITPEQYKKLKRLKRENLRDHMDDFELIFTMLGERATTEIHRNENSQGMPKLKTDASGGGKIAGDARKALEKRLKRPIISAHNYLKEKESQRKITQ